jgi:hypothetical protein
MSNENDMYDLFGSDSETEKEEKIIKLQKVEPINNKIYLLRIPNTLTITADEMNIKYNPSDIRVR